MGDKNERKWAANIAFVGDESKVKALIKQFQEAEERGEVTDFTQINGPFDRLQDLLKDRAKNLSLPPLSTSKPKLPESDTTGSTESTESTDVIYKSDYEQDIPIDYYDEDTDE